MLQSVALMIFILIPTLTFAAGSVAPQFTTPNPFRGADFYEIWAETEASFIFVESELR